MKKFVSFFLLFLTSLVYFAQAPTSVEFLTDSFDDLKAKAKAENKPFFVSFHTDWSVPCQNMNAYTYPNANLAAYVSDNYLAKKVTDENDPLTQQFGVSFFPTIIIFDPNGKQVSSLSGFKNAADLKKELKKHEVKQKAKKEKQDPPKKEIAENTPPAKKNSSTKKQPTTSPKKTTPNTTTANTPKKEPAKTPTIFEPIIKTNNQSAITRTRSAAPAKTRSIESNSATLQPVNSRSGLYKISMSNQASTGIGVQVGVYGNYANVLKQVAYLEDTYKQNVLVNIADMGNKTVFKIIVGPFSSRGQADGFKKVFEKREKRKTMVIDLDSFQ